MLFYSAPKSQLGWLNLPHLSTFETPDPTTQLVIYLLAYWLNFMCFCSCSSMMNVGIQCCKRNDVPVAIKAREHIRVDPFGSEKKFNVKFRFLSSCIHSLRHWLKFHLARLARHVELDWLDTSSSTGATCNLVMVTVIHLLISYSLINWSIH